MLFALHSGYAAEHKYGLQHHFDGEERTMKMPELFDLTDCVAVVTGGNGGIGRSIALG